MTLDELQKLCDEATPGPWSYNGQGGYVCFMSIDDGRPRNYISAPQSPGMHLSHLDASLIAAARTYLPKLIAVAEAATELRTWATGSDAPLAVYDKLDAALEQLED